MQSITELRDAVTEDQEHPSLAGFWSLILERLRIQERREKGNPSPWTKDRILRDYHFCNIRRADDWGTRWYLKHVVPASNTGTDLIWRTMLYRMVNVPELFEKAASATGLPPAPIGISDYRNPAMNAHYTRIINNDVGRLYSPAYIIFGGIKDGGTRNRQFLSSMEQLEREIDVIASDILAAPTMDIAVKISQHAIGVGGFIGYQVARDLVLAKVVRWDENAWTAVGPGAMAGLFQLFGDISARKALEYVRNVKASLESEFPGGPGAIPDTIRTLSLCDVQHCLCEYAKYTKWRSFSGKRRYYKPHHREP